MKRERTSTERSAATFSKPVASGDVDASTADGIVASGELARQHVLSKLIALASATIF